jgi:hypothetical protein
LAFAHDWWSVGGAWVDFVFGIRMRGWGRGNHFV